MDCKRIYGKYTDKQIDSYLPKPCLLGDKLLFTECYKVLLLIDQFLSKHDGVVSRIHLLFQH